MRIAITGSSGLVGNALTPFLETAGYEVIRMVRREPSAGEVRWDPSAEVFDASGLEGVTTVIHLAGEPIAAKRWNAAQKDLIRDSRIGPTERLCTGIAKMKHPPRTLLCASAIGFYGDRGEEILDEQSPQGTGFLADVVAAWEEATAPATKAGIRVVNVRLGVIQSLKGGGLAKLYPIFNMGGGGIVGGGQQYCSWIVLDDVIRALGFMLDHDSLAGPVNVVSPSPVTNTVFTSTLGHLLNRPTMIPLPAFAAKMTFGEVADELLLVSQRVIPKKLTEAGFQFNYPELEQGLYHALETD